MEEEEQQQYSDDFDEDIEEGIENEEVGLKGNGEEDDRSDMGDSDENTSVNTSQSETTATTATGRRNNTNSNNQRRKQTTTTTTTHQRAQRNREKREYFAQGKRMKEQERGIERHIRVFLQRKWSRTNDTTTTRTRRTTLLSMRREDNGRSYKKSNRGDVCEDITKALSAIESTRLQRQHREHTHIAKLKERLHHIKHDLSSFKLKVIELKQERSQESLDRMRTSMVSFEEHISAFKQDQKVLYDGLMRDEHALSLELETMREKFKLWKQKDQEEVKAKKSPRKRATAQQLAARNRLQMSSNNGTNPLPSEVVEYQTFVSAHGRRDGWLQYDHEVFCKQREIYLRRSKRKQKLKLQRSESRSESSNNSSTNGDRKHQPNDNDDGVDKWDIEEKSSFIETVAMKLLSKTESDVRGHEKWYAHFLELERRNKAAIEQWKTEEKKRKEEEMQRIEEEIKAQKEQEKMLKTQETTHLRKKKESAAQKVKEWREAQEKMKRQEIHEKQRQERERERRRKRKEEEHKRKVREDVAAFAQQRRAQQEARRRAEEVRRQREKKAHRPTREDMERLRKKNEEKMQKRREKKMETQLEEEEKQRRLDALRKKVSSTIHVTRDPSRLTQLNAAARNRINDKTKPSGQVIARRPPHLMTPAWRKGMG
eukprot:m.53657 g.53657  ORF g.53657 m.53657 type:complete len:655 (+) comp11052_c0_seq1:1-1965(+)